MDAHGWGVHTQCVKTEKDTKERTGNESYNASLIQRMKEMCLSFLAWFLQFLQLSLDWLYIYENADLNTVYILRENRARG